MRIEYEQSRNAILPFFPMAWYFYYLHWEVTGNDCLFFHFKYFPETLAFQTSDASMMLFVWSDIGWM